MGEVIDFVNKQGQAGISPLATLAPTPRNKGVAERGSRTKGWRGGVWPKAEKKIVTSPTLMTEVVVEVPKGTLDGSPGVQDVFESL